MKTLLIAFWLIATPFFGTQSVPNAQQASQKQNKIQIALLLDTSNSMDGLIDQTKSQLWNIVNEMATARINGQAPILELALYEFGNDRLSSKEGYIRQLSMLTSDLDKISEDLFSLKTYGGSEYCGWVIQSALEQLDWSADHNDLKMIFIAGNEPFDQGPVNFVDMCKAAIAKGITVNTIHCGSEQVGIRDKWKQAADLADGKFMIIDQDQRTVYIETPFDTDILKLNERLNRTYIGYGVEGKQMAARQEQQDKNAASYGAANMVQRTLSKSSGQYRASSWDLVEAYMEDEKIADTMSDDELPEELKGKDKKQIKAELEAKRKEREQIQQEIRVINAKRDKYVADKHKEMNQDNTLEQVFVKAVRDLATRKNYTFDKK